MPMFDYKGADGRELVALAYDLAIEYSQGEPEGWRRLTAEELGVDPSNVDAQGFFRGTSLPGAQAHVLGKFENGTLTRLSVAFTATNDGQDPGDYGAMDDDSYANDFNYLLDAVRFYAAPKGLTGEDVIVTGYSLGAGAANTMAAQRDTSWGGFYADSDYIGVAVPKLTEISDVLNFGFENDVVHRVVGEGNKDANAASPTHGVEHNDGPYATSTDNVVLFNDMYATGGFEAVPMTLGNIPRDWAAHVDIPDENWVRRIGGSNFYEFIEMDSAVVIAHLSEAQRGLFWVEDKQTVSSDHFGADGFVLGSDFADRLGDGTGADMIDGFAGDDIVRIGAGDDRVHGGEGTDTVQLASAAAGYTRVRLIDGTLYLRDAAGGSGVEELVSVERLTTRDPLDTVVYDVTAGGLVAAGQPTLAWATHREGGIGADALTTTTSASQRLFGREGDDGLSGNLGADWLHGGDGKDALRGNGGADLLQGWDGDDWLQGGAGADEIDGGFGVDTADYSPASGRISVSLLTGQAVAPMGTDTLRGIENVTGGAYADTLTGDAGANRLAGGGGADVLTGGRGLDVLLGDAGNDTLYGNQDADTLNGGAGADRLEGGWGRDTLTGGLGADTFVFSRFFGTDQVTDFGSTDTIALRSASFGLASAAFNPDLLQHGSAATGDEGVFLYDAARRTLFWDADGAGGRGPEALAVFSTAVDLTAADFLLL